MTSNSKSLHIDITIYFQLMALSKSSLLRVGLHYLNLSSIEVSLYARVMVQPISSPRPIQVATSNCSVCSRAIKKYISSSLCTEAQLELY